MKPDKGTPENTVGLEKKCWDKCLLITYCILISSFVNAKESRHKKTEPHLAMKLRWVGDECVLSRLIAEQ